MSNSNEVRSPVNVVMVRLQCKMCFVGEMQATASSPFAGWDGADRLIAHQCDKCGASSSEEKSYPHIEYQTLKQIDHEVH